ncbi:MAG TPA: RDD family protein [Acidimicrobiia bacterium]|nr:RDD family protein [Acidimicrobiia bacterium]
MTDRAKSSLNRLIGSIVGPVMDAVEPDDLLERVDVNAILERIDIDELLQHIDVNALMARIDIDQLLDRIDIDAMLDRIDVNRMMARVDIDGMLDRIDVNGMVERVDINAIVEKAHIEEMISRSTRGITQNLLDLVRRQLVGLDVILDRIISRFRRKRPDGSPIETTAAGATRLTAFFLDSIILTTMFSIGVSISAYIVNLFLQSDWKPEGGSSLGWLLAFLGWSFVYFVSGWAVAGRTLGMGLVGLRVVTKDAHAISFGAALVRMIFFPTMFVFGIGAIGIVLGRRHRGFPDLTARTIVVYDWGERTVEAPRPLSHWFVQHGVDPALPHP